MFKQANQLDHKRRRLLKGSAIAAAAIALPGTVKAACGPGDHQLTQPSSALDSDRPLTNDDVTIELVESVVSIEKGSLARVTISNKSDRSIKLSHVSPGVVTTPKGVYQLNAKLRNHPIAIRPNGAYQFWLRPDDGTDALLSRKPVTGHSDKSALLEVSVISDARAGTTASTQRVQAII